LLDTLHVNLDSLAVSLHKVLQLIDNVFSGCPLFRYYFMYTRTGIGKVLSILLNHGSAQHMPLLLSDDQHLYITKFKVTPDFIGFLATEFVNITTLDIRRCQLEFDTRKNTWLNLEDFTNLKSLSLGIYNRNITKKLNGGIRQLVYVLLNNYDMAAKICKLRKTGRARICHLIPVTHQNAHQLLPKGKTHSSYISIVSICHCSNFNYTMTAMKFLLLWRKVINALVKILPILSLDRL
jgi:hypothetical protein